MCFNVPTDGVLKFHTVSFAFNIGTEVQNLKYKGDIVGDSKPFLSNIFSMYTITNQSSIIANGYA